MTVLDAGQDRTIGSNESQSTSALFDWFCNYGVALSLAAGIAFWAAVGAGLYFIL